MERFKGNLWRRCFYGLPGTVVPLLVITVVLSESFVSLLYVSVESFFT